LSDEEKNMNHLSYGCALILVTGCLLAACKKNNTPANLGLLQHRWQITSINGEAYRYVGQPGDYYDFGMGDTLIEYLSGHYDTAYYKLTDGGQTLDLYPVINSVSTSSPFNLSIKTLTSSQLIFGGQINPSSQVPMALYLLDSLRR
jgi:hypothetical protein